MNSRIARKRLNLSKHFNPDFVTANHNHLNVKAARYLKIYNKVLWFYSFKPKPQTLHIEYTREVSKI